MTAYMMCKHAILKAKNRFGFEADRECSAYYTGYVTGIRDRGELTDLQVRKLDNLITAD